MFLPKGTRIFDTLEKLDEEALAAKKDEMHTHGAESEGPFAWKVMGGSWTKAHLGVDYDAFRAECRTAAAKEFVAMYSMQYSASFTLTLYGEDLAKLLAEYWTKKMSWYYDRWVLADRGLHVFTDAEVAEFPDAQALASPMRVARFGLGCKHCRTCGLECRRSCSSVKIARTQIYKK